MRIEQRVITLENQQSETNERLERLEHKVDRIEISVKNTQDGVKNLFLHSAKHERQIESLRQETRERFDQLEFLIRQLLPNKPN